MAIALAKNNDIIKKLIRNIKNNDQEGYTIVDDLFALSIALENNEISDFFYSSDYDYRPEALELLNKIVKKANNIYTISNKTMEQIMLKNNSSHMIAVVKLPIVKLDSLKNKKFILIADGIEIPGNLGTIFRTIDATGCEAIISINSVTKLNNTNLVHSSRGMNLLIPQIETTYEQCLKFVLENEFTTYLGEPELGLSYDEIEYEDKLAIVVGSERYGITPDWYNHPNRKVYIPMYGKMGSLNVGVAASILLYQIKQQKK